MTKYSFNTNNSPFFQTLRKRVDSYFAEHKLRKSGGRKVYFKGTLMIGSAALLYIVLVFFTPIAPISIFLCILLGLNLAVIGFNVMHEGGHGTFSRHHWVNRASAYLLNVLGGNAHYWSIKHNIGHHTYTNIEGMDSDIDVRPFMRLHEGQPLRWYHRYQHIYWVILYGISYLAWVFYDDFVKYFTGKTTPYAKRKRLSFKEHAIFWFTKLTYMGVYMVIPILVVGWLPWLTGFLIVCFTCGLAISIVFQLAHVVEGTEFHNLEEGEGKSSHEWAVHQIRTTSNFGTSNKLLYWLMGGLNFQIEHHLFPRISHIHYPAISKLVKETCREYNIIYNEYSSMFKAIVSHLVHLRRLGRHRTV